MLNKLLSKSLYRVGNSFYWAAAVAYQPSKQKTSAHAQWCRDKGDKTLRLNYELTDSSLVFDLGGYEGQWASDIFSMHGCSVYIFEPVGDYANNIKRRFAKNNKIRVHDFGLSHQTQLVQLCLSDDATSVFKKGSEYREGLLVRAEDFFKQNGIEKVD